MAIVPYRPNYRAVPRPVSNMLDDFFGDSWHALNDLMYTTFKLDVREEIMHYTVEAELPGISKDDIEINFKDGILTIRVQQNEGPDQEGCKYIQRERCSTSMQRSVSLEGAQNTGITAALSDGVLRITVPKDESVKKNSKIEIQ